MLRINAGPFSFVARLEEEHAPETVATNPEPHSRATGEGAGRTVTSRSR